MNQAVTEEELKTRAVGPRVTKEAMQANIKKVDYIVHEGTQLTICILTLQNGYTVTGESACADPANFQKDIGERISRENAEKKIWGLMGYALKQELYLAGEGTTFFDRLKNEFKDLSDKIHKLNMFINGNVHFKNLHLDQQNLLLRQYEAMNIYAGILNERIEANKSNT